MTIIQIVNNKNIILMYKKIYKEEIKNREIISEFKIKVMKALIKLIVFNKIMKMIEINFLNNFLIIILAKYI